MACLRVVESQNYKIRAGAGMLTYDVEPERKVDDPKRLEL
jgi:hypothetical protein